MFPLVKVLLVVLLVVIIRVRSFVLVLKKNIYILLIFLAPGGIIPNANLLGSGGVITMGNNLSSVDPNNFPGTVHFGPSTTTIGTPGAQFLPGAGFVNPNLGLGGGANFNTGF